MGGRLLRGDGEARFRGAAIDSRRTAGGELFFALPGARTDGHDYALAALDNGATGVVVHQDVPHEEAAPGAWIRVEDTFEALHALTRAVRQSVPQNLVAITGSSGKTTTKELLTVMLERGFRVAKSPGNFNNTYGFPLALLGIPDDTEWMVAEMGMSTPGELAQVSHLGRPNVAVFTNVRPVHLENFRSVEAIAEAKSELLAGAPEDVLVIANADDAQVMRIARRHVEERGGRLVTYGLQNPADVSASDVRPLANGSDRLVVGCRFELAYGGEKREIELPIHGLYNVENCLAAAACALELGLSLEQLASAVAEFRPASMRGVVHRLKSGPTVIDDSYNANPDAVARALESARLLPARRRIAVLGDMLELGPKEAEFHTQVGKRAAELGFDHVVAVGQLSRQVVQGVEDAGGSAAWFASATAVAGWLGGRPKIRDCQLGVGDLVLVKGSRGIGLEKAVEALVELYGEGA